MNIRSLHLSLNLCADFDIDIEIWRISKSGERERARERAGQFATGRANKTRTYYSLRKRPGEFATGRANKQEKSRACVGVA